MVTIYSRLQALELPYDKSKMSEAGEKASHKFDSQEIYVKAFGRVHIEQVEPIGTVKVWAYTDDFAPHIDSILLQLYKPKRKRIARG